MLSGKHAAELYISATFAGGRRKPILDRINFPSRPGAQQGSGVIPGQTFSGIQPRLGKNKDLSGEEGRASFGNNIEDDLSLAVENFPRDRIPVQFLGEIGIS